MSFSAFRMALYNVTPVLNKGPIYNTFQIEESSGGMYDHLSGGLGTTGEAKQTSNLITVQFLTYGRTNATKPQIKLASRRTTQGGQESVGCPLFNPA